MLTKIMTALAKFKATLKNMGIFGWIVVSCLLLNIATFFIISSAVQFTLLDILIIFLVMWGSFWGFQPLIRKLEK